MPPPTRAAAAIANSNPITSCALARSGYRARSPRFQHATSIAPGAESRALRVESARRFMRGDCMSLRRTLALSLLFGMVMPATARADGMIVPFLGVNFGGNSGQELSDAINAKRFDWGVSLAYMGGGVLGVEADIARSPDFFGR